MNSRTRRRAHMFVIMAYTACDHDKILRHICHNRQPPKAPARKKLRVPQVVRNQLKRGGPRYASKGYNRARQKRTQ